jgi:DNA-binding NarL/FixJ family response regulator
MRVTELFSEVEYVCAARQLGLSPRQTDIVKRVLQGKSDKQIARELGITLSTVRTHMCRLFQKYDLDDRMELVLMVLTCLRGRLRPVGER